MKILITGAAGMLGSDLVDALQEDFQLVGLGLADAPHLRIPYSVLDLTDVKAVEEFWLNERPELVFHLAAMTHVDLCESRREDAYRANMLAVKNIADTAKNWNVPVVFFSTDFVFDGTQDAPYTEEQERRPLSYYGETKCLAEDYLKRFGGPSVIFRICWLYGLRGRSFPRAILDIAAKQNELKVVADQIGRPTYTRDVSAALAGLLKQDAGIFQRFAGQTFHLANEGTASWADFAEEILKLAQCKDRKVLRIGWRDFKRDIKPDSALRPEHAVLSLEKTRQVLGITLRDWRTALKDFIKEYQEHPVKL